MSGEGGGDIFGITFVELNLNPGVAACIETRSDTRDLHATELLILTDSSPFKDSLTKVS